MKISHYISSIDLTSGGPARSVTDLINHLAKNSTEIKIKLETLDFEKPIIKEFKHKNVKLIFHQFSFFLFSRSLIKSLKKTNYQIFHIHGIWQMPTLLPSMFARNRKIPYVITLRGMLEPWSLSQKSFKKKVAMFLFQRRYIQYAKVIHVTCSAEAKSVRDNGFKNPIAIIPNGINLDDYPNKPLIKKGNNKKILFLSRIHEKKGLENLIHAWGLLNLNIRKNWKIDIVGNGESNYIKSLTKLINSKGLTSEIKILKPVFGMNKINLFRSADLFVLPTYSENFGVVIAEALASFTPVITTHGAPWQDLEDYDCGLWIETGVSALSTALKEMILKDDKTIEKMGLNGRKLIEDKFSMREVSRKMFDLYDWILDTDNKKPEFIYYE